MAVAQVEGKILLRVQLVVAAAVVGVVRVVMGTLWFKAGLEVLAFHL
jgi:hypothetical protein